jgi:hypothetical protein
MPLYFLTLGIRFEAGDDGVAKDLVSEIVTKGSIPTVVAAAIGTQLTNYRLVDASNGDLENARLVEACST